jgi:hypothetical protein
VLKLGGRVGSAAEAAIASYQLALYDGNVHAPGDVKIGGTLPGTPNITLKADGNISAQGAVSRVYADNAAAKAGGLVAGDVYRKADGTLMITF